MWKRKKLRSREYKDNSRVINIEEARQKRKQKREEAAKRNNPRKTKKTLTHRQAVKKARRRMVYFLISLFIIGIIGISVFNIVSLKLTEARVIEEQQELLNKKTKLESIYSQVNSPEFIEQQARHQLKMIKPGEILYVLPNEDEQNKKGGIVPN